MPRLKSHGTAKDSSSRRWLLVKAKGEKIQAGRVSIAANGLGGILSALKRSENVMGSKCLTLTHDHDACQVYEHVNPSKSLQICEIQLHHAFMPGLEAPNARFKVWPFRCRTTPTPAVLAISAKGGEHLSHRALHMGHC